MAYSTGAPAEVESKSKSTIRTSINTILPPELLALAFSFLVSDAVDAISFKSLWGPDGAEVQRRFSQHPLWNASLVCRAWYKIIKETPRFWAFVAIGVMPYSRLFSDPFSHASYFPKMATPRVPRTKVNTNGIETLLERSGRLPLTVVMCPENIQDFGSVSEAIQKHFDRLEILSLIAEDNRPGPWPDGFRIPTRTTVHQVSGLLARSMPSLKVLSVAGCLKPLADRRSGRSTGIQKDVEAPELETLSCHTHIIFPESPTRLSSLSLTRVDIDELGRRSVELPNLVDLKIENCDVGSILSSFVIPSLRRLVVGKWGWDSRNIRSTPAQLPRYDSLEELQWHDIGEDPVFVQLCRLCLNLKRYCNYIEGDSIQKVVKELDHIAFGEDIPRPMIFTVFDEDVLGGANAYRHWPVLEEVSLIDASRDHVATLIKAVPSIKRVRVLRDRGQFYRRKRDKLAELWGKVEIAIRDKPWESASRGNETPRKVAETL
ncbi:hypothetical protein FS837_002285 [Tulasnella sp. UAMH 9824]|nr:hypothetical protein FS837_002285 [Tulasnella sp. UAMH 9824]